MPQLPPFQAGQSARCAHRALQKSLRTLDQAQHGAVLWFGEIMRRRLYRDFGHSTMRAYALAELDFSPTRAGDFIRLARKLEDLPAVKAQVASGRMGYTKAREVVAVAEPQTEKQWVAVAQSSTRAELSAAVKRARRETQERRAENPAQGKLMPRQKPAAPPAAARVRVGFELTPSQYAHYEALLARAGHRGNTAELLLAMAEALADAAPENAPRGAKSAARPPCQIHVHACPQCGTNTVQTPRGELVLSASETAAVHCDAQIATDGQRNTRTIPPATRRRVLARDRHRCRHKGCTHSRHLHLHHITPRARGGTNQPENLVTLCAGCHHLWHERGGDLGPLLAPVPGDVLECGPTERTLAPCPSASAPPGPAKPAP